MAALTAVWISSAVHGRSRMVTGRPGRARCRVPTIILASRRPSPTNTTGGRDQLGASRSRSTNAATTPSRAPSAVISNASARATAPAASPASRPNAVMVQERSARTGVRTSRLSISTEPGLCRRFGASKVRLTLHFGDLHGRWPMMSRMERERFLPDGLKTERIEVSGNMWSCMLAHRAPDRRARAAVRPPVASTADIRGGWPTFPLMVAKSGSFCQSDDSVAAHRIAVHECSRSGFRRRLRARMAGGPRGCRGWCATSAWRWADARRKPSRAACCCR